MIEKIARMVRLVIESTRWNDDGSAGGMMVRKQRVDIFLRHVPSLVLLESGKTSNALDLAERTYRER